MNGEKKGDERNQRNNIRTLQFYYPDEHIKNSDFTKQFKEAINDCLSHPERTDSQVLEIISPPDRRDGKVSADNGELEIFAIYKKVRYNAKYYPKTKKVILKEKEYKTPSGAGTAVTKHTCDGWLFWRFIDKNGKEQKLKKYRN